MAEGTPALAARPAILARHSVRDLLTGLAILLIVALTTALVAPYLVDWNSQRAFLEARLSHALGQKVTIGGDIDLKLLPTPYLVLDQTVIGSDDGPIRMGIRHLNLELSVAPLLHGEFDIIEAQLREPTIRVTLDPDRSLPSLPNAPAFEANLRFDRIEVDDGTIAIADPRSGHTFVFDHLDFTADAPSLGGPFKGVGAAGDPEARTKFHFVTTAAQKRRARAHLLIDETSAHAGLDLDGLLTLAHTASETIQPSFDGTLALSSHVKETAWHLSGPLKLDARQATLVNAELRIGDEEAGVSLQAEGEAALGETPKLTLALSAKQLDLDRLSGPPSDGGVLVPPKLPDLATLRGMVADAMPVLPTDLDVKVEGATYGGATLSGLSAHLDLGGKGPQKVQAAGEGPGGLHLSFDGQMSSGFTGQFEASAQDVPSALTWLAAVAPDVGLTRDQLPFDLVKAAGHIVADPEGVAATDLQLTLDRSDLTGTGHLTYATATQAARLAADVQAKALDLDALPNLATLRGPGPFDLDLKLDANAIKVSRLGDGDLQAGHLTLALTKIGRHLEISQFRADDLGGATIDGAGSLDPDKAALSGTIDAEKLGDAANVLRRLVPGRIADALVDRAAALAPAKLTVAATFAADETGALGASRLDLGGRLAATAIDAHLAPDLQQAGGLVLKASADAPEGTALLGQLGFEILPLDLLGHSRLSLTASGTVGQSLDTTAEAALGGLRFATSGRFDVLGRGHGGSGTFSVKGDDIGPLLQSLALAFPDMTGRIPIDMTGGVALAEAGIALSDVKGSVAGIATNGALKWQSADADQPVLSGALDLDRLSLGSLLGLSLGPTQPPAVDSAFSNLPFAAGLVDPPRTALKLRAKQLDLGIGQLATDAAFDLGVAPNLVTLQRLTANIDGGKMTGDATLRRDGDQAAIEGKIGVDGVKLDLPSLKATMTGRLDIAGSGGSSMALASSLAGSGDAVLAQTMVPGADPAALPHIFDAVEADDLSVDEESVLRALDDAVKGPLDAGERHFRLGLAAGTLRWDAADAPVSGPVTSVMAGSLDLRNQGLDQTTTETLRALPKSWVGAPPSVAINWEGSLRAPKRGFDVGNFLNAVAARALARETARIEAYEFDIRERAFFNARLQSDRRREEDRLAALDQARKADEARLAAEKAAADQAADETAARKKAAQDKAAQDRIEDEKALRDLLPDHQPEPKTIAPPFDRAPAGTAADPSAAGRY